MIKFFIWTTIIIGSLIGYGYWKSLHYGYAHINLLFKSTDNPQNYTLSNARVFLLNADESILAEGVSDKDYGTINLIHPTAGNCRQNANLGVTKNESGELWRKCYQEHAKWIPLWIKKVTYVKIKHKKCNTQLIPVHIEEYNSGWQLWWVPLPHVGGEPQSYFSIYIDITDADCVET